MKIAKKSLGQNFLKDKNVISKIINLTKIKNRNIIEIGPGQGALTDEILKNKPKSLTLIEKDDYLVEKLKIKYQSYKFITIINKDILKISLEKIIKSNSIVLGNLPYNISSQILVQIVKFKKWPPKINDIIFMFQKELANKIIAKYPSSDYGRISILSNLRLDVKNKFLVSPNCFFPKPKIISMVIHFQPKKRIMANIKKISSLEKITNIFFSNRRKMINKCIKKVLNKKKISRIPSLNLNLRPAEIKPNEYYQITELYEEG